MENPKYKARILTYYLPQFHPIPENDKWWGKGFTEWTNVRKAKPLFPGHYQPRIPGELGYYDLRDPEVREKQAALAREYGIEGFVYWHYWFGNGKQLLERPFNEVLASGKPDFPFALAWANESWRGFWHGLNNEREVLIEQTYPGREDYIAHFNKVLPALKDHRYITCDGKPVFFIYNPNQIPDLKVFVDLWRELAAANGLNGIWFVGIAHVRTEEECEKANAEYIASGIDSVMSVNILEYRQYGWFWTKLRGLFRRVGWLADIRFYDSKCQRCAGDSRENFIPVCTSGWDHTPRTGEKGSAFLGYTPRKFKKALAEKVALVQGKPQEKRFVLIKSWNEWAEGNYLEPDRRFGRKFLEAVKSVVCN